MPTRAHYLLNTSEVPNLITLSYHTQIQDYLKGNVCLKEYCKRKRFCDSLDTKLTQTSITLRGMEAHTMKPQQGLERNSATGKKHLHNQSYIQILPILLKSVIWIRFLCNPCKISQYFPPSEQPAANFSINIISQSNTQVASICKKKKKRIYFFLFEMRFSLLVRNQIQSG